MSASCEICIPLDCVFPADLELYGLQGPQGPWTWLDVDFGGWPVDPVTGNVRVPVPGFGGYEWVSPGSIPTVFPSQSGLMNIRVLCCDFTYVTARFPSTGTAAQKAALMQRVFAVVAQKQALCNRQAKISATNKPHVFRPGRTRAPFKLSPFPDNQTNQTGACIGIPFTKSIGTSGAGLAPFSFEVISGSVPPGLQQSENLAGTALILAGRPKTVGTYDFIVQVTDSSVPPQADAQSYEITVLGVTNAPPNSNGEIVLPDGNIGYPYVQQLTAGGGIAPRTFSEDPDFPLPDWVFLSSTGLITGTPPASAPYLFGVIVTDSIGTTCKSLILINVYDVRFTNFGPPGGVTCSPYSFQFTASPAGCTFAGSCPPGLSVNAAGLVSGKPCAQGTQIFNITATDAHGRTANKTWSIVVTDGLAGYAAAIVDLKYQLSQLDFPPGNTTAHTGAGGTLSWAGHIGQGAAGQAIANDRWLVGLKKCDNPTYQINFSVAYHLSTTQLGHNVRLVVRVSCYNGSGGIIPSTTINATQLSQSGTLNGSLPAGWTSPIDQATTFFEFSLFADALPAGQSCDASVVMTVTPLLPP